MINSAGGQVYAANFIPPQFTKDSRKKTMFQERCVAAAAVRGPGGPVRELRSKGRVVPKSQQRKDALNAHLHRSSKSFAQPTGCALRGGFSEHFAGGVQSVLGKSSLMNTNSSFKY